MVDANRDVNVHVVQISHGASLLRFTAQVLYDGPTGTAHFPDMPILVVTLHILRDFERRFV